MRLHKTCIDGDEKEITIKNDTTMGQEDKKKSWEGGGISSSRVCVCMYVYVCVRCRTYQH